MTEVYEVSLLNHVIAENPVDAVRKTFGQMNYLWWSVDHADGSHAVIRTVDVVVMPELGPLGLEYRSLKGQVKGLEALVEELRAEIARLKSKKANPLKLPDEFIELMKRGASVG